MTRVKMYAIINSILEDAFHAIDARREDILQIAGECINQAPEAGANEESVKFLHDLLRVDDCEELLQWLELFYDGKFNPVLKEDYLD